MKPTKAQQKMLNEIAKDGDNAWTTPGHTTTTACERHGWIIWTPNEHGVDRARLTEAGRALVTI